MLEDIKVHVCGEKKNERERWGSNKTQARASTSTPQKKVMLTRSILLCHCSVDANDQRLVRPRVLRAMC